MGLTTFFAAVQYVLYLYIVIILARVASNDPPVRPLVAAGRGRGGGPGGRLHHDRSTDQAATEVVPPLQIGGVSLDLSILILLLAILALRWALSSYAA